MIRIRACLPSCEDIGIVAVSNTINSVSISSSNSAGVDGHKNRNICFMSASVDCCTNRRGRICPAQAIVSYYTNDSEIGDGNVYKS